MGEKGLIASTSTQIVNQITFFKGKLQLKIKEKPLVEKKKF